MKPFPSKGEVGGDGAAVVDQLASIVRTQQSKRTPYRHCASGRTSQANTRREADSQKERANALPSSLAEACPARVLTDPRHVTARLHAVIVVDKVESMLNRRAFQQSMLSIPNYPVLDKIALIGGCARLDSACDAARLQAEVAALPTQFWGQSGGRVGVHNPAQAVFLRGHAPAQGDLPVANREALLHLPYLRELIHESIPAPPLRCLLALLPAGALIAPHIDQADYFSKTIRLHMPVTTSADVWMYCAGSCYQMRPGEVWALNNSSVHGAVNADAQLSRIHLICDFLPSPALLHLLTDADRGRGKRNDMVESRLFATQAQPRLA